MLPRFAYERGVRWGHPREGDREGLPEEIDPGRDAAEVRSVDTEDIQRPAFDGMGPGGSGALDGALGERDGLGAPAGEHQVGGQPGQDARLICRRRRPVEEGDGLLEQSDRGGGIAGQPRRIPDAFSGAGPPSAIIGGVGIDEFDGALSEFDRVRRIANEGRCRTRRFEQVR